MNKKYINLQKSQNPKWIVGVQQSTVLDTFWNLYSFPATLPLLSYFSLDIITN